MKLKHLPTIRIKIIPHSKQRYDSCGDYWQTKNGNWEMRISQMNPAYEEAVIEHELHEMVRTIMDGVKWKDIDEFDIKGVYEVDPKHIDDPGLSKKAPYHSQHMEADKIERFVIKAHGKTWDEYCNFIDKLKWTSTPKRKKN